MKEKKMYIHYDSEADYLEIRFGRPTPAYYKDLGDDLFERRDEKTNEVRGFAVFNFQKRKGKQPQDIELPLPAEIVSS